MIESLLALMAFFGFGFGVGGDVEEPNNIALHIDNQQIIRAIDSNELKRFNILEAHDANEWFV